MAEKKPLSSFDVDSEEDDFKPPAKAQPVATQAAVIEKKPLPKFEVDSEEDDFKPPTKAQPKLEEKPAPKQAAAKPNFMDDDDDDDDDFTFKRPAAQAKPAAQPAP